MHWFTHLLNGSNSKPQGNRGLISMPDFTKISERKKNTVQSTILIFCHFGDPSSSSTVGTGTTVWFSRQTHAKAIEICLCCGLSNVFLFSFNYHPLLGVSSDSECFHGTSDDEMVPRKVLQCRSGTTNASRQVTQGKISCFNKLETIAWFKA